MAPNQLSSMVPATCMALVFLACAQAAHPFAVGDLPRVRCVSNYLYAEPTHDLAAWRRDLDHMKGDGFNTVWMVNVWAEYEPSVEPVEWREDLVGRLCGICAEAEKRGMWVVLPLAYVGEGWGPKGLDVPIWPLVDKHRKQHLAFLARIAAVTKDCPNVFTCSAARRSCPAPSSISQTRGPSACSPSANGPVRPTRISPTGTSAGARPTRGTR